VSIFELTKDSLVPISDTTFAAEHIRERYDLQRLFRENIAAIAPETYVLAEEYGGWKDAKRRIDLFCLDKHADLVVIEIKRTEDGGHMELQAIRYAAMVSRFTFADVVEAHSQHLGGPEKEEEARAAILNFLEWDEPNEKAFAQNVRIILVSSEFSKEITTSVIWLNERELDIRCVRIKPYSLGDRVLVDIQQVLPLPEAEEYQVQIRKKAAEERLAETGDKDWTKYDLTIAGEAFASLPKRRLFFLVFRALIQHGVTPEQIMEVFPARKFLVVPGTCGSFEEFWSRASKLRNSNGTAYNASRFFTDEIFNVGGNAYVVSNQWSKKSLPDLQKLIAKHPKVSISFTEASEEIET
jgi:hypothetical protein